MKNTATQQPTVLTAEAASKREYIAPAIEVIELEKHSPILAASGVSGSRQGYESTDEQNWGE